MHFSWAGTHHVRGAVHGNSCVDVYLCRRSLALIKEVTWGRNVRSLIGPVARSVGCNDAAFGRRRRLWVRSLVTPRPACGSEKLLLYI